MGGFNVSAQSFGVYQAIEWLSNDNTSVANQIRASERIRGMLNKSRDEDIVRLNITSRLNERLEKTTSEMLKAEIIWTLANIAAGPSTHTKLVLKKGLKKFLELLEGHHSDGFKVDIVWILANIAGDSASCRDDLIHAGVLPIIVKLLKETTNLDLQNKCVWLLSNIVRHLNPPLESTVISECIFVASKFLKHEDPDILSHICWIFKYLADGTTEDRDMVIASGICQRLVDLNSHPTTSVVISSLLVCINITAGTCAQADSILNCGLVKSLSKILSHSDDPVVIKNTCLVLSNIAAGNEDQVQQLVDAEIFSKLNKVYGMEGKRTQIEILHIINNTILSGTQDQLRYLISLNLIETLCLGLFFEETNAIKQPLEGLLWSYEEHGLKIEHRYSKEDINMDITQLFKACVKTVRLQNKSITPMDKNRILRKQAKDEFSKRTKEIKFQISQLRNFLIENRAAYMQFACHLKRSAQMTNEERDIIDRESEKIINICTQFICELKLEYNTKNWTKQQRVHADAVIELLADYLKGVYNIFNDQKNYRIRRDLETYKFLKLDSEKRRDDHEMEKIEYKEEMDLDKPDDDAAVSVDNDEEEKPLIKKTQNVSRKSLDTEISASNQSIEDDANTSRQQQNEANGLSAEDLQMLEIENKQLLSEFKGLSEEVQQIEKHVYDIAKLQELFTEKVALQKGDIERISNTVVGATENVREANEQIKQAIQRNAGLRVYVLFFLLVMSFSLLFLDWYND